MAERTAAARQKVLDLARRAAERGFELTAQELRIGEHAAVALSVKARLIANFDPLIAEDEVRSARREDTVWCCTGAGLFPQLGFRAPIPVGAGELFVGFELDATLGASLLLPYPESPRLALRRARGAAANLPLSAERALALVPGSELVLTGQGRARAGAGANLGHEVGAAGVAVGARIGAEAGGFVEGTLALRVKRLEASEIFVSISQLQTVGVDASVGARAGLSIDANRLGLGDRVDRALSALGGRLLARAPEALEGAVSAQIAAWASVDLRAVFERARSEREVAAFTLDLNVPEAAQAYDALIRLNGEPAELLAKLQPAAAKPASLDAHIRSTNRRAVARLGRIPVLTAIANWETQSGRFEADGTTYDFFRVELEHWRSDLVTRRLRGERRLEQELVVTSKNGGPQELHFHLTYRVVGDRRTTTADVRRFLALAERLGSLPDPSLLANDAFLASFRATDRIADVYFTHAGISSLAERTEAELEAAWTDAAGVFEPRGDGARGLASFLELVGSVARAPSAETRAAALAARGRDDGLAFWTTVAALARAIGPVETVVAELSILDLTHGRDFVLAREGALQDLQDEIAKRLHETEIAFGVAGRPTPPKRTSAMITCHLKLQYFNSLAREDRPLPDGILVRAMDHDLLSRDDSLGEARTKDGRVRIEARREESKPDIYFVIAGERSSIDQGTNTSVPVESEQPGGSYIRLDDLWSSKNRYSTDYTRGWFNQFDGDHIGTEEEPLTFRYTFDCFIQLGWWNETLNRFSGLPAGVKVEAREHETLRRDPVMGSSVTDKKGRVHIRLQGEPEHRPDLYFRFQLADDALNHINPGTGDWTIRYSTAVKVPKEWSSRERFALEDPSRSGYWKEYVGSRIGVWGSPYVFEVLGGGAKTRKGHRATPLVNGPAALERIEALIRSAQRSIHVQVMLFYRDPIGLRIRDLLIEKANQGVEVRLMFDHKTTRQSFSLVTMKRIWARTFLRLEPDELSALLVRLDEEEKSERERGELAELVDAFAATPNVRVLDTSFPYVQLMPKFPSAAPEAYQKLSDCLPFFTVARIDHRKMFIVDGHTTILGGMNVGQEYLYDRPFDPARPASEEEWVKWHDAMVELKGPVVRDVQKLFRERWVGEGGDEFDLGPHDANGGVDAAHPYFPKIPKEAGGVPVRIINTTPGARFEIHDTLLGLIDSASKEIWIQNPYFSTREVLKHLEMAAERGVKVVMIFPDENNDSLDFLYAARLEYDRLMRAGVEVYEYQNHMTHAKIAVIDGAALIGSSNLNHASLFLHYECLAVIEDSTFAAKLRNDVFVRDTEHARRIQFVDLEELLDIRPVAEAWLKGVVWRWF